MKRHAAVVLVVLGLAFAGCAAKTSPDRLIAMRYDAWRVSRLDAEIARAGSGDVAVTELGRTAWGSHHVAVVRTSEKPHYHRFHDLTVVVLRGEGVLTVEQRQFPMTVGDVAHVRRGAPHFFRNTSEEPSAALVIFSPPFDGRDVVGEQEPPKPEEAPKSGGFWPFR
jgi:mannose-6-phosphate isomerase-like protein (cupin superfamily)